MPERELRSADDTSVGAERPAPCAAAGTSTRSEIWNHYGRLTAQQEQAVLEETWREVIAPALALLLDPATHSKMGSQNAQLSIG